MWLLDKYGSFTGIGELVTAIPAFIDAHNSDLRPFVWTASVEAIVGTVDRCPSSLRPTSV
jgi:hypothetical protein